MTTIAEITTAAKKAVNEAYGHYFIHLASGQEKTEEINAVVEILRMMQPWLFFTETSMEELVAFIYKDSLNINLVYSLTAMFRQNFVLEEEDYQRYIKHLAVSFNTQENEDENLSMMAAEYRGRLTTPDAIEMMLKSNRFLVMLASTMLYLDTTVLSHALMVGKK